MFGDKLRRSSLYESRVWGTPHSPPKKNLSLDLSMIGQESLMGPIDAGSDYFRNCQSLRDGLDVRSVPQINPGTFNNQMFHQGNFFREESDLRMGHPVQFESHDHGMGFRMGFQMKPQTDHPMDYSNDGKMESYGDNDLRFALNQQETPTAFTYDYREFAMPNSINADCNFSGRSGSDVSYSMYPNQVGNLATVGVSTSGTNPSPGYLPSQRMGAYSPEWSSSAIMAHPGDSQDRNFTHMPQISTGVFNTPVLPPPNNVDQNAQQPLGVSYPNVGEQFPWNRNPWNDPSNENNFQNNIEQEEPNSVFRRYSYGDTYRPSLLAGPIKQFQTQKRFNSVTSTEGNSVSSSEQNKTQNYGDKLISAVDEYFTIDVHQRVKVSMDFFYQRLAEERKYLDELYQLPQFPLDSSARNLQLVLVCFKAGRLDVFYIPDGKTNLKSIAENDLVIVEADRGRDLGKVVKVEISADEARLLKLLQFLEQLVALSEKTTEDISLASLRHGSGNDSRGPGEGTYFAPPTLYCPKPIISIALYAETILIINKGQDEEKACRLSLAKISSTLNLINVGESKGTLTLADLSQMRLIDAEYQFDRRKLIFYYSTSKRIDFRDLVRELFRIYKTRIWMCAVTGIPYHPTFKKTTQKSQGKQQRDKSHESKKSPGSKHGDRRLSTQSSNLQLSPEQSQAMLFNVDPVAQGSFSDVPRKFYGCRAVLENESRSHQGSGESLVLKSLVDTLND